MLTFFFQLYYTVINILIKAFSNDEYNDCRNKIKDKTHMFYDTLQKN